MQKIYRKLNDYSRLKMTRSFLKRCAHPLEQGIALPGAVAIAVVVLVGSLAIVVRVSGLSITSIFSGESLAAKQSAEAAIDAIISEFNLPSNRTMLAAGGPAADGWQNQTYSKNPCLDGSPPQTDAAKSIAEGEWRQIPGSESLANTHEYRLKRVVFRSPGGGQTTYSYASSGIAKVDGSTPFNFYNINLSSPVNTGKISLLVEARIRKGDSVLSRTQFEKEFEVVPKCCSNSFGTTRDPSSDPRYNSTGSHGNDDRSCLDRGGLPTDISVLWGRTGGCLEARGNALSVEDSNGDPLNSISWVSPDGLGCPDQPASLSSGSTQVSSTPIDIPPPPPKPSDLQYSGCISSGMTLPSGGMSGGANLNQSACTSVSRTSTVTVEVETLRGPAERGNCLSGEIKRGNQCYALTTESREETVLEPQPFCIETSESYDCLLRYVNINTGEIKIDPPDPTKKVNLFFYDSTSGDRVPEGGSISLGGSGVIGHYRGGSTASLNDAGLLNIYGNIPGQSFELRGTADQFAGSINARTADLTLKGTPTVSGILWVDNLTLTGNATIQAPPNGDQSCDLEPYQLKCLVGNAFGDYAQLVWDFKARSVFKSRGF